MTNESHAVVHIEDRRVSLEDLGSAVTFVGLYPCKENQHGYLSSFGRYPGTIFAKFSAPNGELCSGKQLRWGHL